MSPRDRSRRTEGSLLFFALLILTCGALLVYLAKTRGGVPPDAVNLNAASADELALTLEIDPTLARVLVRQRDRLGGFTSVRQPARLSLFPDKAESSRIRAILVAGRVDVNSADAAELARLLSVGKPVGQRIVAYRDSLPGKRFKRPLGVLSVGVVDPQIITALGPRLIVRSPASVFWELLLLGLSLALLAVLVPALIRACGVRGDPLLIPIAFLLSGLGVLILFSLRDPLRDTAVYTHHVYGLWMGMLALTIGSLIPARQKGGALLPARSNLRRYTYLWAFLAIGLTLVLWAAGSGPEGVRLSIGPFQPMEAIKILLVLFLAGYLTERGDLIADALHRWRPPLPKGFSPSFKGFSVPRRQDLAPILVMYALSLGLFIIIRDMGPALLLFGVFLATLYLATGRAGIVWLGLLLAAVGGLGAYTAHLGVIPIRVDMWRSPWSNTHPLGMQLGQGLWAMSSGGIPGTGLGLGLASSLARGRDDMIFAALGEELGLIGTILVVVLYVVLVGRGLRAAVRAQSDFDRLLAGGLTALIGCQTFLILAGVTGLLPLTGITLPFVSYGNSSLVADFFLLGLLRGISAPTESVPIGAPNLMFRRTAQGLAVAAAFGLLGLIGLGRLFWIQAARADHIAGRLISTPDADGVVRSKVNPRLVAIERAIPRGSIYDRRGKVLATSRLDEISKALPDDPRAARRYFRKGRYYPHGPALVHLVGYLDPALGGPVGTERDHNRELRGFRDYSDLVADYRAKDLPWRRERRGSDVYLTVDSALQEDTFRILKQAAGALTDRQTGKRKQRAAMVILDPVTGEALASVTLPSFDPNNLTPRRWEDLLNNKDGAFRLVDRSRFGTYPPGSSIKVATAAAGLEDGIDPTYDCNQVGTFRWRFRGVSYGPRKLSDDRGDPPHNQIRMERALKVSCNLYFANLGIALGAERLHHTFSDRFDLHAVKPLDQFAAGLPDNAFGQGTMVATPTEMARIAASVANKGEMMRPAYLLKVVDSDGRVARSLQPDLMGRPIGELNAQRLGDMMRGVVTDGTARGVFHALPVEVAGKTGTAQTDQGDREPHSWFIGFTPYSRPKYAFACVIENGGYGKRGAAPAVRDVLLTIFGR